MVTRRISRAPVRRYRRLMVRIAVRVRPAAGCDKEDEFAPFDAVATTLGAGGLFIPTQTPFLQGHPMRLRFALPGSGRVHELVGRVVWSNSPGDETRAPVSGNGRSPGMGIEFVDRAAVARLARELDSCEPSGPDLG